MIDTDCLHFFEVDKTRESNKDQPWVGEEGRKETLPVW